MKLPFGQSLLAAEGDKWRNQRRWIRPAFSRESLREATQNMAAAAAMLVERWRTFAAGSRLDISLEMHKAMMTLLERTLFLDGFGRDFEEMLRYLGREFDLTARIGLFDLLNVPAGVPRMVTVPLRPVLAFFAQMASDVIATRERRLAASPLTPPNDLVTVLLRAHRSRTRRALTKQEVASNIHLFFAAADEASANALCWVLYLLGLDPEWRERVEMEADRELPDGRYVEGSLERLVATRAVIEEALRLYPPVASINRQAIAADRLGEHSIKRGTYVIIAPWVVHRHCLLWDAPDLFDPSRFLPGAREAIDRFAYLPFGAGPRTCIGASFALQTLIIMLSTIVRSFRLEIDPEHKVWPVQHVTVHPKGGLPMILHRRRT